MTSARPASLPLDRFERGRDADPAVHDKTGKARQSGFFSSPPGQRVTSPRLDGRGAGLEGAEPSRLVDRVGRGPDEDFLDSEGSTLPPPYSQIV